MDLKAREKDHFSLRGRNLTPQWTCWRSLFQVFLNFWHLKG